MACNFSCSLVDILQFSIVENLKERRLFETLMFMRKILKNEVPALISELFQTSSNDQYNLRSNDTMLKLAKPKTNAMKRSFGYYGAKAWNYLPADLKNLELNENEFKANLKEFISKNVDAFSNLHVI